MFRLRLRVFWRWAAGAFSIQVRLLLQPMDDLDVGRMGDDFMSPVEVLGVKEEAEKREPNER